MIMEVCKGCKHPIKFDKDSQQYKHFEVESNKLRSVCVYCGCLWAELLGVIK